MKKILTIFLLSINILILIYLYMSKFAITSYQTNQKNLYPFGCINKENVLIQHIYISNDLNIKQLDIKLATYATINSNINNILLKRGNDILFDIKINSKYIIDNSFYHIPNLNIPIKKGDELTISISSEDATSGNCITAWISNIDTKNKLFQYNTITDRYIEKEGELVIKINDDEDSLPIYLSNRFIHIPVKFFYALSFVLSIFTTFSVVILLF